jgi:hypothetical protein
MIIKKYILETLNSLDSAYNGALGSVNLQYSVYFSKLATLEYCGWIEETLDNIACRSVKRRLKTIDFQNMHKSIIDGNYGFQYKNNFRPMMSRTIGLERMEKLEKYLKDTGRFEQFISELEIIKRDRDDAAHTWINETTKTYPAPSYIRSRLLIIYPIIKGIYTEVAKL